MTETEPNNEPHSMVLEMIYKGDEIKEYMDFPEIPEGAKKHLDAAISLAQRHNMPMSPYHYAILKVYVSGSNPELNDAMDTLLETRGSYSHSDTKLLYDEHMRRVDAAISAKKMGVVADDIRPENTD